MIARGTAKRKLEDSRRPASPALTASFDCE